MAFTFCLYMIAFCVAFSFLVCSIITVIFIAVLLLQLLYQFPYLVWAGWTGKAISHPDLMNCSVFKDTVHATKLYKHWIFHTELGF